VTKLPLGVDINNLIDDLRIFSWEAADVLLFYSQKIKDLNYKSEIIKGKKDDPVTLADLKVNELIIERINNKYQNIPWEILSEENYKVQPNNCDLKSKWLWVLDPLDGTKDFIQDTGNYAMHLALNFEQKPHLGIVLIPERDELWISNGNKVWCEKRDGTYKEINTSKKSNLEKMTLVTSKNNSNTKLKQLIDKVNFMKVVVMGSIGCKIASIIRGDCDVYISLSLPGKSSPKDWDFAAPDAILRAAGGAITNLRNQELIYGTNTLDHSGVIIASNNKQNHKKICSQIEEIIKKYEILDLSN